MAKTKIILASTLSVLAVASVTTAAVVVTMKNKMITLKKGNEGNQVVVAANSKFEYALNPEQTNDLTAKLLLVKGQDVTVTLTENNASKTIKTKVKEDGTVDFSSLKDGKTYTVAKIVVKEDEKERDLIAEVKAPKTEPNKEVKPGDTTTPMDPIQGDNPGANGSNGDSKGNSGSETKPTEGTEAKPNDGDGKKPDKAVTPMDPIQGDNPGANGGNGDSKGPEAGGTDAGKQERPAEQPVPNGGEVNSANSSQAQSSSQDSTIKNDLKVNISKQWYDKDGYINFHFKTSNENYEKIKNKKFTMEFELQGYENQVINAGVLGTGPNAGNVWTIKKDANQTEFYMFGQYYFDKRTNAPKTKYTLIGLYVDGDKKQNILNEKSQPINVDYK